MPASWLVFGFALLLMQLSSLTGQALIGYGDDYSHLLVFISTLLGMAIYAAVLLAAGRMSRFLPTMSAIVGCGALLGFAFIFTFVGLREFIGDDVAVILATLFIFWSVPVEGHIIARAIGRDWYLGIAIAMLVFIGQYMLQTTLAGRI